ncbi:MAG: DUF1934 domain-containing protein [Clostridiaceae bacterium]|nr:DUF1934 domain-containing protein [Clostridiaceae bacterium]
MQIKKPVKINIISEQWTAGEAAEPIKLMSMGTLVHNSTSDEWTVRYDESEATGMQGTKTSLSLTKEGNVHFVRNGTVQMNVLFEAGNHFKTQMETPYGLFDITILTNEVEGELSEEGGKILLSYSLNFPNNEKISTRLDLTVHPEEN